MNKKITVEMVVNADIDKVWKFWNEPEYIQQWFHASDDWECPKALNDLKVGGRFTSTMRAKDLSTSFDLSGTYTAVEPHKHIAYTLDDNRTVTVDFTPEEGGIRIVETFEMENQNSEEMQRGGWQAILENFKGVVER